MPRPTLYVAVKADYDEYQRDLARMRGIAREQGKGISDTLNNAISPKQAIKGLTELSTSIKQAAVASRAFNTKGVISGLDEIARKAGVSTQKMDSLSQAMLKTARENALEKAFANIQKQAGLSTVQLAKLRYQLGDTSGAFKELASGVASAKVSIAAAAASVGIMGKAALDATLELDRLKKAYTSIMGSDVTAETHLDYIYGVTQTLGLQFQRTAEAAKGFFASSVGTPLEKDMKSIFEGVVSAGAALSMTQDQMSGVFLAISQIASKGKLSMEEVHQIAERFPGTFEIIATALGVSRQELVKTIETGKVMSDDMLPKLGKAWKEKYGDAAIEAAKGVQGAMNLLSTQWTTFKASLIDSDTAVASINAIRGALEGLENIGSFVGEHETEIATAGTLAAAIGLVVTARKLDIVESGKQVIADARLYGVQATLADRFLGVDSAERQRLATEKALQSESVKAAQAALNEAQAVQRAALASEQAARQKLAQAVAAKESAVTSRQVQTELAREAAAISALHAAQVKTYATTNALDAAQQKLAVSTQRATASILNMGVGQKALSGLKSAAGGLVSFLGGGWGIAFMAATAGVTYLTSKSSENQQMMSALADEYRRTAQEAMNAAGGVGKLTEEMAKQAKATAENDLAKAEETFSKVSEQMRLFGNASFGDVFRTTDGFKPVLDILQDLRRGAISTTEALDRMEKVRAQFGRNNQNVVDGTEAILAYGQAQKKVEDGKESLKKADEACAQLGRTAEDTKSILATGWTIDVSDVTKGVAAMEKSIRSMQAEMLGGKAFAKVIASLPNTFPLEKAKELFELYKNPNFESWQRAGQTFQVVGAEAGKATDQLFSVGFQLEKTTTDYEDYQKKVREAAKDQTAAANRAATALAAYDAELAKLTKSSRELEQVKIEEKLRKIAKDAKLPTAELDKLRKAMEQEADFKWMQDILSYADPAAAAVAKVDKEYEAFLRNVEYLKKTDPAKYTQLMTKAETEHEKALRKAERASKEQNEHLQEKLSFYKELEEMSGAFGLSLEVQNRLLDEQMEIFRDADIPENLIQTWRQYKDLMNSHDWADGAQRAFLQYRADATDAAKGTEEAFSSLFEGMDSGFHNVWQQMLEDGKVSLSSFKSLFASFLADLMHMAITRPITVQIAGVVSGMLGTVGVAYAAGGPGSDSGGTGGLLGNIPFSSILPDSWTSGAAGLFSGITGGINSFASNLTGGFFASSATEAQFNALANSITGGWGVGGSTLLGTLGAAGAGFGLGSLAGSLLFPNQPNISTGAGIGGGLGAAIGSVVPGIGTLLGGTIGSLLGGGIGSLFGGGRRTHASVYGKMEDVGFSRDQQTYIDAFMGGAWYDRAGKSEAEPFAQGIAQVASQTAGSLLDIAGALPEQIRQNALSGLETSTWSAGRGVSDASWNFQWWEEGMAEERLEEAAKDMRNRMTAVAQQVFSNAGISQFFSSFDVTTDEGLQKASTALSAISAVKSATDAIKSPLSEMEQQAQSAKAQLDAWTQGMKDSGVNAQYAAGLINEYRNAFINDYIKTLDESLHPLSAYEQAIKDANESVDQRKKALEIIGATESQLAQVEAMRAEVVKQATEEMLRSFDQSVAQRWAAVNGNADEVGRAISQANELRETIQQFGEGSAQVAELLKLHAAETAKAAQDAAKSEYDSLKAQMDALEQQRVQLQQQAIHEQINAINEQLSAAKTLKSTWEGLDKSLGQSRYNLFAGSANLDAENRLGTVQAEFRRLSGLALGGDSEAAGQLAGVGTSLLDIVKQTAGTEEEYLDAFWAVNAQLKSAQDAAGAQVSAADKELEALQGQLDVQNAALAELQGQRATLEEIEKQIAELKPLLGAAGDKAGVKAFARGGLAMPGWAVVGEEGPELVNFSQPGRVYTAADTAALFRSATPRAADTDSGSDAEVKALRREVYQLRRDMLISMSEIARFSRRTSDMVEAWDAEGMPGVRA